MKARKKGKKPPKTVYRNPALLALAEGQECLVRVPKYCWGGTESTVAAHSNQIRDGKGKGIKAHDWATAHACGGCHYFLDQSKAPLAMKLSYFVPALRLTRLRRIAYSSDGGTASSVVKALDAIVSPQNTKNASV